MLIKAKNMGENRRVDAARPCPVILTLACGRSIPPCCWSAEESRARFFAPLRCAQNDRLWSIK